METSGQKIPLHFMQAVFKKAGETYQKRSKSLDFQAFTLPIHLFEKKFKKIKKGVDKSI